MTRRTDAAGGASLVRRSNFVWRPEALPCDVARRGRGGIARHDLVLYYELNGDPVSDDFYPDETNAHELFDIWMRRYGQGEDVDIWWFVMGDRLVESALRYLPGDQCYEDYYALPRVAGHEIPLASLPVIQKRWTKAQPDKGGFIPQATGWAPAPMQRSVSPLMLSALASARRK